MASGMRRQGVVCRVGSGGMEWGNEGEGDNMIFGIEEQQGILGEIGRSSSSTARRTARFLVVDRATRFLDSEGGG